MACHYPRDAWRQPSGVVVFREPVVAGSVVGQDAGKGPDLLVRCGTCLGCRKDKAFAWTLRNLFEWHQHQHACWVTLTYAKAPISLDKSHLQTWLKRVRRRCHPAKIRFFACGEYGEKFGRPHYHCILYGVDRDNLAMVRAVEGAWQYGIARVDELRPEAVAYVAGYVSKKYAGTRVARGTEVVDSETGEVMKWQDPFLQMSRNPGIGANARAFASSFRDRAVHGGRPVPVPRYWHEAWKAQASDAQLEALQAQRDRQYEERFDEVMQDVGFDLLEFGRRLVAKRLIDSANSERQSERRTLE